MAFIESSIYHFAVWAMTFWLQSHRLAYAHEENAREQAVGAAAETTVLFQLINVVPAARVSATSSASSFVLSVIPVFRLRRARC